MKFTSIYVADYENTTNTDNTYVYGFGIMELKDKEPTIVNTLEESIELLSKLPSKSVVYFHNFAKYDGWIILDWLLKNGFTYTTDKNVEKRFNGIITYDDRQIYQLRVRFNKHFVEFRDSCKLVAGKLDKIGNDLGCLTSKLVGTIDYNKERGPGYVLTNTERAYLRNDVVLLKEIVEKLLSMGTLADFITCGAYAFNEFEHCLYQQVHNFTDEYMEAKRFSKWYKKDISECYRNVFPQLPIAVDLFCRDSYKGGYCINWTTGELIEEKGIVLDVNSLYPSVLRDNNNYYPFGESHYFRGEPPKDKTCFIVKIRVRFELKPGCLPFIQLKKSFTFAPNEYISVVDDEVELTLTSVDLKLLYMMYTVYSIEYVEGYWFDSYNHFFDNFIDKHYEGKKNATNDTERKLHKIVLNSAYGRFGQKILRTTGIPSINEKDIITLDEYPKKSDIYKMSYEELEDMFKNHGSTYLPLACFTTAYARFKTITTGCLFEKNLCYIDTDSLHLRGVNIEDVKKVLDIDPKELGYWDHESTWSCARFVRQKTYVELLIESGGKPLDTPKLNIKACGLTDDGKEILKGDPNIFLNFTYGLCLEDSKLMKKTVKGGVTLVKADFNIRK